MLRHNLHLLPVGWFFLFLLVMGLSACSGGGSDQRTPGEVADAYVAACLAGERSTATALIAPELRDIAQVGDHCTTVTQTPAPYTRYTEAEVRVVGEIAYVPYLVVNNGDELIYEIMVIETEEGWRLQTISYAAPRSRYGAN